MKFGLRNTSFVYPNGTGDIWADVKAHLQRAETDGFYSFWAVVTSYIRLGAMVSPVGYRNPALLARMAASLDHISSGRMNFGFGAGGFKPEYQTYGFESIDKASVHLAQMKEALQLILGLWSQPCFTFHGEYFHVEDVIPEPGELCERDE